MTASWAAVLDELESDIAAARVAFAREDFDLQSSDPLEFPTDLGEIPDELAERAAADLKALLELQAELEAKAVQTIVGLAAINSQRRAASAANANSGASGPSTPRYLDTTA